MFESLLQNKIEIVYTCTEVLKLMIKSTNSYKRFYFSNNPFRITEITVFVYQHSFDWWVTDK